MQMDFLALTVESNTFLCGERHVTELRRPQIPLAIERQQNTCSRGRDSQRVCSDSHGGSVRFTSRHYVKNINRMCRRARPYVQVAGKQYWLAGTRKQRSVLRVQFNGAVVQRQQCAIEALGNAKTSQVRLMWRY